MENYREPNYLSDHKGPRPTAYNQRTIDSLYTKPLINYSYGHQNNISMDSIEKLNRLKQKMDNRNNYLNAPSIVTPALNFDPAAGKAKVFESTPQKRHFHKLVAKETAAEAVKRDHDMRSLLFFQDKLEQEKIRQAESMLLQ